MIVCEKRASFFASLLLVYFFSLSLLDGTRVPEEKSDTRSRKRQHPPLGWRAPPSRVRDASRGSPACVETRAFRHVHEFLFHFEGEREE